MKLVGNTFRLADGKTITIETVSDRRTSQCLLALTDESVEVYVGDERSSLTLEEARKMHATLGKWLKGR